MVTRVGTGRFRFRCRCHTLVFMEPASNHQPFWAKFRKRRPHERMIACRGGDGTSGEQDQESPARDTYSTVLDRV